MNYIYIFFILKDEEPMEQNMEDLIPKTMEPMEQKESMENINRPRTTTPTNIMVIKASYIAIIFLILSKIFDLR